MTLTTFRSVAIGGSDARRRLQGCSLFSFEEWEDEKGNKQERQYGYSLGQLEINHYQLEVGSMVIWLEAGSQAKATSPTECG